MKIILPVLCLIGAMALDCWAGVQQDFFAERARLADRISITATRYPETPRTESLRNETIFETADPGQMEKLIEMIELLDPTPEGKGDDEIWELSSLSFGIADYHLIFYKDGQEILKYGTCSRVDFLAPFGPHAEQGIDALLDYKLTRKSAQKLRGFILSAEKNSNK